MTEEQKGEEMGQVNLKVPRLRRQTFETLPSPPGMAHRCLRDAMVFVTKPGAVSPY